VGPDVARAAVEDDARDAEELGEVLADDLRADGSPGVVSRSCRRRELAVLDLRLLERCTRSRRRALS
jgi:hypothetical protein